MTIISWWWWKEQERARDSDWEQKSMGKAPQKQLPTKSLKKKSGGKGKTFTGAIKKPTSITQAQWHSSSSGGTREALNYCAGSCVWPDWSGKSHKILKWTFISRQQHCWPSRRPWKLGWSGSWRTWTCVLFTLNVWPSSQGICLWLEKFGLIMVWTCFFNPTWRAWIVGCMMLLQNYISGVSQPSVTVNPSPAGHHLWQWSVI